MFRGIKLIYYFIELMSVMYARLIFSLVFMIIMILREATGFGYGYFSGRRLFRSGYNGELGVGSQFDDFLNSPFDNLENDSSYGSGSTWLADKIRRRKALKACKKFLKKDKNIYILKNTNVNLSFHSKKGEFVCFNRKNTEQKFTVTSVDFVYKSQFIEPTDETKVFNLIFDNICASFDESSTYEGIKEYLKNDYNVIDKTDIKRNRVKVPDNYEAMPKVEDYCENAARKTVKNTKRNVVPIKTININIASDEELAALPGINIISAKKIIKYRELHNGFESKEDFYAQMKINEKIQAKIDNIIVVEKKKNNATVKKESDERIVDL